MQVIRAQSAGFCWGVERAIDIARDFATKGRRPVYTDGPLIHNSQMMDRLQSDGIREVGDYQSSSNLDLKADPEENAVLVVRAHGISPERRKYLKSIGIDFKDATCPDVGIVAGKIRMHAKKGYSTVIFGDEKHPEVIGLMGYTEGKGHPVQSEEDIDALPDLGEKVVMVSQTTMFTDDFRRLADHLKTRFPNTLIFDTICGATKDRQGDIAVLFEQEVEAFVVIGGHHSANTCKLALLARKTNLPVYHIETAKEIDQDVMRRYAKVGVTAGASTPEFLISEVCNQLAAIDHDPGQKS
ncbi:4-hydroxy-3-methylbut-2-enyl diphosphate reductase [Puniceicoccales bacterium CK1056]|uniref:4-hydroxy-3-methylbut-2-enyl diphosphate reductase n=1 Tax=Oceanipulchritudo coccoides TaxID=2706888 RepID=A0A6B2M4H4_9BACT|nr:4-hydroxy-3-methylbut-2-enyl diphosphate reductase [Oceanipulchritudo coccoides]NDV62735.1 4-hydroxy-3-methylbut-2-enyl diphosphate reductase [Oceanipulchritudo coccoides]